MKRKIPSMIAIDLDGTLIDSVADLHRSVAGMQTAMGVAPAPEVAVRDWVGNGIERLVHRALSNSMEGEATAELFDEGLQKFRLEYHKINGQHSVVYPAVPEILQWLSARGIPLTCVTNKARAFTLPLLEAHNLSGYFSLVMAGDDVSAKKPHPEALLSAADYFNASPAQCLMIGDSISDVKAARAAGFDFIGVSYGYNHGQPLQALVCPDDCRAIIDSFAELKTLI